MNKYKENSLLGFVYRVLGILKALWILVWNHQYFEKFATTTTNYWVPPPNNFTISLCNYVHSSLQWLFIADLQSVFKEVLKTSLEYLRRFEVVFWCLEWECCTFQIIDEKLKIHLNPRILHSGFKWIKTVRLTCRGFHSWVVPSSLAEAMITSSSLTSDTLSSFFCWWRSFHSSSSTILPQLSAPPPASSSFVSPSKSTFPSEQQRDIWTFCYYLPALSHTQEQ